MYRYHVREYTKKEVEELLQQHGFEIMASRYSEVYDRTLLKPSAEDYLKKTPYIDSYCDTIKFVLRDFSKINFLLLKSHCISHDQANSFSANNYSGSYT